MRVLLTSVPVEAHFNTMVALGWALQAAGHDVRVAAKPKLAQHITHSGLTAVPLTSGDEHSEVLARLGADLVEFYASIDFTGMRDDSAEQVLSANDVLTGTFYATANDASFIVELAEYARSWQADLIIWEQFTFAGAVAAHASGIPHGRLVWGPDLFHQMRRKVRSVSDGSPQRDDALRDWLESAAWVFGREFDEDLLFGQWQIELSPPEVRLPPARRCLSTRYVPYNGVSVLPHWLSEPPKLPRVALTMGITARGGTYANPVDIPALLRRLADLEIEVVATVSAADQADADPLPERFRLVDFVPLRALLPTCDAIIHHGGSGTWASALAAGIPQLIVSDLWDNVFRGQQLAELGAGIFLNSTQADPLVLREKIGVLLEQQEFRSAASRLEQSMQQQPAPSALVPQLEEIAAQAAGRGA